LIIFVSVLSVSQARCQYSQNMKKYKVFLFVVIALSLALRMWHEVVYDDMYIDKLTQIATAKNLVSGNGFTVGGFGSGDFTLMSNFFSVKYAPAYSLFIIPFYFITGNFHLAAVMMDIFFVLLLYLALIKLFICLEIPYKKQMIFFAFLGISFTPMYHLTSSDLISLAIYQWAVYFSIYFLKIKTKYFGLGILSGFLLFLTGASRYSYYPMIFALPFSVFIIGKIKRDSVIKLFSVFSGVSACVFLLLQSIILKLLSGSAVRDLDETGFFLRNLLSMDVFPFKSLFFYEGLEKVLFAFHPLLKTAYILVAAFFSAWVVIEIFRFIMRKTMPDSLHKDYLITGITVLMVNVFFLVFMSLTHKGQDWKDPPWTFVEETRYYSQSMLFIAVAFLTFILFEQYQKKTSKIIYKFLVFIVMFYAGAYWVNNIIKISLDKKHEYTFRGMYKEKLNLCDIVSSNLTKDKPVVFVSPDNEMSYFVFAMTGIQAVNWNYNAVLNDSLIKNNGPINLFIATPHGTSNLKNLKKYSPEKIGELKTYDLYKTEIK